ncbi:MAG: hypothetical protein AB7U29_02230 [Desulfobulbus sp.]
MGGLEGEQCTLKKNIRGKHFQDRELPLTPVMCFFRHSTDLMSAIALEKTALLIVYLSFYRAIFQDVMDLLHIHQLYEKQGSLP